MHGYGTPNPDPPPYRIHHDRVDDVPLFPPRYKWLLFGWCMAAIGLAALRFAFL